MIYTRRDMMKKASLFFGSTMVAPMLGSIMSHVRAENAPAPKRFVFVVKSSGVTPTHLVPPSLMSRYKSGSAMIDEPLDNLALPPALNALEPFKQYMTILQGLSGRMCRGGHSSWFGAMACYRTGGEHESGYPARATIDGILAKSTDSIFPHVGLTIGGRPMEGGQIIKDSVAYPGLSVIAPGRELPYQGSPQKAFNELFGMAVASDESKLELELRSSLLDFMTGDIKRAQSMVSGEERQKLDRYLQAFESLGDRKRRLQGIEAQIRKAAPEVNDKFVSKVETDRLEAHFDIAASTLIAGLSQVIAIRPDTLSLMYGGLGLGGRDVHGIGHGESVNGKKPEQAREIIDTFHIAQIARLAAKLQSIPEGDGTMLGNTLILYFSDAADKHHGSCTEWPFLMVGGMGDRLKKGGRYIQYPSYDFKGHRTIANLYNTLLTAKGMNGDGVFGVADLKLPKEMQTGPLQELLRA